MVGKSDAEPTKGKKGKAKGQADRAKRSARKKGEAEKTLSLEVLDPVDSDLVEKSLAFINGVVNETAEKGSRLIAQHILEAYFDNSVELAKSRNPKKKASYAALQNNPDLLLSASSLNNMVRVEIQRDYLASNGITLSKLSYSHQLRLARLPEGREKLKLARNAIEDEWSVRTLEEKVKNSLRLTERQVPLIPNLNVDFTTNPSLLLGNDKKLSFVLDRENLKRLSQSKREKLRKDAALTKATLDQYEKDLAAIIGNLDEIEKEESDAEEEA